MQVIDFRNINSNFKTGSYQIYQLEKNCETIVTGSGLLAQSRSIAGGFTHLQQSLWGSIDIKLV